MSLFIVSTPFSGSAALAAALWSCALGAAPALQGGVADDPDKVLAPAGGEPAAARLLGLVRHPAEAVAEALAHQHTAAEALARWTATARRLLRAAHHGSTRALLVDTAEAQAAPQALAQALSAWHPAFAAARIDMPQADGTDPVLLALAQMAVPPGGEAARLFDELSACCVPLGRALHPAAAPGPDQAAVAYRRALQIGEDLQQRQAQLVSAQAQLASTQAQLASAQAQLASSQDQLASSQDQLAAARGQLASSQDQLASSQDQLAAAQDQLRGKQRALAGAADAAELHAMLLRQAHEELDGVRAQLADCERQAATGGGFRAVRVTVQHVEDQPPHRHADLEIQQFRLGTLELPALQLRLLEHHGRPGLALFRGPGPGQLLSAWQAMGDDAGRAYMLLVPDDTAGRDSLARLGTSDWDHLLGLVDGLPHWLHALPHEAGGAWAGVAGRLRGRLAALPPRLRYDDLQVEAEPGQAQALRVRLHNTRFGNVRMGQVGLHWQLDEGSVAVQLPDGPDALPVSPWPLDDQGRLAAMAPLPLGRAIDAAARRGQWGSYTETDRLVVLGLLDALSAVATQAPGSLWRPGLQAQTVAAAAGALRADVQQTLGAIRRRRLARRLLGRAG